MRHALLIMAALTLACAPRHRQQDALPMGLLERIELQRARAEEPGKDQVLEQVRLASLAMSIGYDELANQALTSAVLRMQDFEADGQFRATVGVESAKEWKGEPYEKMMAFLYLAQVRYSQGDYSNALAMTKSAILADTGTAREQYRADFVPAYVLQALCYQALGEARNAERSIETAIDVMWARELAEELGAVLAEIDVAMSEDPTGAEAAKVLLLSGLPASLTRHPRDPQLAIEGALSWASDTRRAALAGKRSDWPEGLAPLTRGKLRRSFAHLEPLAKRWSDEVGQVGPDLAERLQVEEAFLRGLRRRPGLVLWVGSGMGPQKVASGRYGEVLKIVRRDQGRPPVVTLDGVLLRPHRLDSVTWQAQTRGGRAVDGFLRGKAVFKDASGIMGIALLQAGEIAQYAAEDDTLAAVLYIAGALVYVGGIVVNPRADTRNWETLPDTLWLVRADPSPGDHELTVDGKSYTVSIPDTGTVSQVIPWLPPRGPDSFGIPCETCEGPLALPDGGIQ